MNLEDLFALSGSQELENLAKKASGFSREYSGWICAQQGSGNSRAPGIHASEISGCQRKLVYSIMGTPRQSGALDPVWYRRFNTGHAIHEMLQKEFHKMAKDSGGQLTFQDEIKISPETQPLAEKWNIHSSCDGLFTFKENGTERKMLLEIKTASPAEFEKLQKPKPEHIEQAHVYMACLGVPITWMLYWNKGNQNISGTDNPNFLVKFNKHIWLDLEDRFQKAHTSAFRKILPDKQESIVCDFCAFAYTCKPKRLKPKTGPRRWLR